jgi:arsenate reductase (thioredoxin)
MTQKLRVLFICTHNSARSQMAEGLLRGLFGDRYEAFSAGTEARGLNPDPVKAMQEIGIDISGHRSKSVDEFQGVEVDYVVTVCDHAKETCSVFSGGQRYLHEGFRDASDAQGTDEEKDGDFQTSQRRN